MLIHAKGKKRQVGIIDRYAEGDDEMVKEGLHER